MRRNVRILVGLVFSFGLWTLCALSLDCYGRRTVDLNQAEVIIVAGCRVWPGGVPSPALARRTELAVQLWREERAPIVLFTGGVGTIPPSEAQVAADYAARLGVPASAIRVESASTSTEENARLAAELFPVASAIVVTDAYHVFRSERVFGRFFSQVQGVGSISPWSARLKGAHREVLAIAWYWWTGRVTLW